MSPPWIERVVQRIEPKTGFQDAAFSGETLAALQRLIDRLATLSVGKKLIADVTALFEGGSRLGKLHAAEAIAHDRNSELYRIDLALAVADDLVETERILRRIFDAAEQAGGILYFDDGDALVGKGTDSDPYPEKGAGYLLKRMGRYEGLTIMSVSDRTLMDPVLVRKFRATVSFG